MTKCGAELVMAAQDQSESRFDPKDPELGGKHAIGAAFRPWVRSRSMTTRNVSSPPSWRSDSEEFRSQKAVMGQEGHRTNDLLHRGAAGRSLPNKITW